MVRGDIRQRVGDLLVAVDDRPTTLPLRQIVALAREPVAVTVDRSGPGAVVFVTPRPDDRFQGLTDREREVAALVAAGDTNRQIAAALFISVATVKDHVHAILTKSGCRSRAAVAASWPRPVADR